MSWQKSQAKWRFRDKNGLAGVSPQLGVNFGALDQHDWDWVHIISQWGDFPKRIRRRRSIPFGFLVQSSGGGKEENATVPFSRTFCYRVTEATELTAQGPLCQPAIRQARRRGLRYTIEESDSFFTGTMSGCIPLGVGIHFSLAKPCRANENPLSFSHS